MPKIDGRFENEFRNLSTQQIEEAVEKALESLVHRPVVVRVQGVALEQANVPAATSAMTISGISATTISEDGVPAPSA